VTCAKPKPDPSWVVSNAAREIACHNEEVTTRLFDHLKYRRRRVGVWLRSRVVTHPGPERSVWISSWQRSGSTWLAEVLASTPRTRLIYEPVNVPDGIVTGEQAALQVVPRANAVHTSFVYNSLRGRIGNHWVDQLNHSHFPRRTVVKDVRGIELVSEVRALSPSTPFVILLRHPFAVAASVVRLGWFDPTLSPRDAFVKEVARWCSSHERALTSWRETTHDVDPAGSRTHWTTYEELTGVIAGDTVDTVVDFLISCNVTWRTLAAHRRDLARRSATDFAGEPIAIEDEWRSAAYGYLVASGWNHLYDEHGAQRLPIAQFLATTRK